MTKKIKPEAIENKPAARPRRKHVDERVDPYEVVIENNGTDRAPRLSAAWEAIQAVLADRKAHTFDECMVAAGDLAENTVRILLKTAIEAGKVAAIYDERAARRSGGRAARKYRLVR